MGIEKNHLHVIQKPSPSFLVPSKNSPSKFLLIISTSILFLVLICITRHNHTETFNNPFYIASNDNKTIRSVGYFPLGTGRLSISYPVTGSIRLYHKKGSPSSQEANLESSYDTIFLMGYLKGVEKFENDYSFLMVKGNGCQDWQETIYDLTADITFISDQNGGDGDGLNILKATTMAKFNGANGETEKLTVGNFFVVLKNTYQIGCGAIERL
ncbi:10064_t:CDS:1 [Ambispora leptoticha]|uniref:10064_t:CDS:1 n=1 Tax=Ambispora leptoticha TaxID=144679 RepID=A0A9N9F865_9GLOM|nr:10064_t:CDS:1 [Ambispora leptoticha]